MPDKIFAGPRIRRIRTAQGLSQTAMAAALGISPSYLNLLERNQRPLTVQLMVKLAAAYGVEADALAGESGVLPALRAAFADPLLATELPGESELVDFAEATPNAAGAMVKLHRAYREQAERLSDLGELLAKEGRAGLLAGARLPLDEVREVLERRPNHFAGLEEAADAIGAKLEGRDELSAALKLWLRREHGIHVQSLPAATMPSWRRRYDRHSQRLFVSERLSPAEQLGEIALEAFLLGAAEALAQAVEALHLSTDEARRTARMELARYGASAILMPERPFGEAARRTRYDVGALAARFRVSFAQATTRLTTLARSTGMDVPFFLLEVDTAGNRLRRAGAAGFPISRFGGACPKLALYAAFAQPGQVLVQAAEMPDGARYLLVARTVEGPDPGWDEPPRRTAFLLGCDWSHAQAVAYADLLPRNAAGEPVFLPAGPVCRLCERAACSARAEPPITRPLGLDEAVSGLSSFDFQ